MRNIKNTVEIILLMVLLFICGYLWGKGILPKIEVIQPTLEVITIEGKVQTVVEEKIVDKPYALVLNKIDDKWVLDKELSYMPDVMTVDKVSYAKKRDWLTPVRVGITIDKKPFVCYNIANIKGIEFGIGTDFEDLYGDFAYRWRNIAPFIAYSINGKFTAGVSIKIF